jgi:hypothetical protein
MGSKGMHKKTKANAVVLAIFFGLFSWLYTYQHDKTKFWINFCLSIITLSLWYWVAWLWAIIDAIRRPESFYEHTRESFSKKQKIILWSIPFSVVMLASILIVVVSVNSRNQIIKQQQVVAIKQARLKADPITVDNLYNALNKERASTGAKALSSNDNLTTAAKQYCNDMVKYKYFDYKNPKTGKKANDFITDNMGNLYFKNYVSSIFSALTTNDTATSAIKTALKNQSTNLNNNLYNSVGWAVCQSPSTENEKYIVGTLADIEDRPLAPQKVYVPSYYAPTYTPSTHCYTTYNDYGGYFNPTATTDCY